MKPKYRIAVVLSEDFAYTRAVRRGIFRHAHAIGQIECHTFQQDQDLQKNLQTWNPDGILIGSWPIPEEVHNLNIPIVSCSGRSDFTLPTACPDESAAATITADHFCSLGFHRVGFVGLKGHLLSQRRKEALQHEFASRPGDFEWFEFDVEVEGTLVDIYRTELGLEDWLKTLPSQLALRTYNDVLGYHVVDACQHTDIRVPDDIAVLGMDDDEDINLLPYPALSSVRIPAEQVGYEAMSILLDILKGKKAPLEPIKIAPTSVAVRGSTETIAIDDPDIRQALEFIHKNACNGIGVSNVLETQHVSRPTFIKRFKAAVGRGPLAEIRRLRMDRAKQLLADTDLTTSEIAEKCGYGNETRFYSTFQQFSGITPGMYRKQFRHR